MMTKDNLSKSTWQLFEVAKDITKKNLVTAVNTGQLKIDESLLPVLMNVIDASINEGFNKGHKNFINVVTKDETLTTIKKKK
jgi:hypothetical protein